METEYTPDLSWIITLRRRDYSMQQKNIHVPALTLEEAAKRAQAKEGGLWEVIAGRILT